MLLHISIIWFLWTLRLRHGYVTFYNVGYGSADGVPETHPMHAYTEQSIKTYPFIYFPQNNSKIILIPGLVEYDFPLKSLSPENKTYPGVTPPPLGNLALG